MTSQYTAFSRHGNKGDKLYCPGKRCRTWLKTHEGKKKVHVAAHTRKTSKGKTVKVDEHYRSTPN